MKQLFQIDASTIKKLVIDHVRKNRPDIEDHIEFNEFIIEPMMITPMGFTKTSVKSATIFVKPKLPPSRQKSEWELKIEREKEKVIVWRIDWAHIHGEGVGTHHHASHAMPRFQAEKLAELWKNIENINISLDRGVKGFDYNPVNFFRGRSSRFQIFIIPEGVEGPRNEVGELFYDSSLLNNDVKNK